MTFPWKSPYQQEFRDLLTLSEPCLGTMWGKWPQDISFNLLSLNKYSNAVICCALRCQESYLDRFEDRFPDLFRFLILNLDSPSKALALWRPRLDQGAATDDPHSPDSPEVTGEDIPPSNYSLSTQAQGLLEPSGQEIVDGGNGRIVGRGLYSKS